MPTRFPEEPNRIELVLRLQGQPVETDYPELYQDIEPIFKLWTNGSVYFWKYENEKVGKENYFTEQEVLGRFPGNNYYVWSIM